MPRFDFPKSARLLKPSEFERVFQQRCCCSDGMMVVYFARNQSPGPRLGLVVSRKCGKAVARNRWKRALREAFRLVQHELPGQLDLVVLPRKDAEPNVARLQRSFVQLAARAKKKLVRFDSQESTP